jgi:hypothetical protein
VKSHQYSEGGPKLPYITRTVRIPAEVANKVRDLAQFFGWELADFLRTVLCIGAVFFFLSYGNNAREEATTTLTGFKLLRLSRSFTLNLSERPYARRHPGNKSMLISLTFPTVILEMVAAYAALRKTSRNETYSNLLQQGLLIYLKAQATILQASHE